MKRGQSTNGDRFAPQKPIGYYVRSFAAEARSTTAIAADIKETLRLECLGCIPVRKRPSVTNVDLASRGSLLAPPPPPLPSWRMLRTNGIKSAVYFTERLRRVARTKPEDLVAITLRPPLSLRDDDGPLLTEGGLVPVDKYGRAHQAFKKIVQRVLADLERRGGFIAYIVVIHPRILEGGAFIDLHAHITCGFRRSRPGIPG